MKWRMLALAAILLPLLVEERGDKLRFVTDQRVWNVDNPEILEGHEGHSAHATACVYPDHNSIHITEVKIQP